MKLGAPAEKIIIGMPTYGRTFTLSDTSKFDIGSPATGGGNAGAYTAESGFMAYYEVCNKNQLLLLPLFLDLIIDPIEYNLWDTLS